MKENKYEETIQFLYNQLPMYQRMGKQAFKKDLTNIRKLCRFLGQPQEKFKSIHIAGTNGKGTVSHMLASIFQKHGLKTGLYTSPHYKDFRERIKINGALISKTDLLKFVQKIRPALKEIQPSFFEISVAMAFWYFARQECDIAIIETGLGGRLDSTNIIKPSLCVITNIGYDHQNMLGNTLEEIAGEKAGIIKSNVPVIIGEYQEDLRNIFEEQAYALKAPLKYSRDMISLLPLENPSTFSLVSPHNMHFESDIHGPFAERNIRTVLAAIFTFEEYNSSFHIQPEFIQEGLMDVAKTTYYLGRWQQLSKGNNGPTIIADSAHNKEGLIPVIRSAIKMKKNHLHIVLGFVNEKELEEMVDIFPIDAIYYFAKANIPRGMPADVIHEVFKRNSRNGRKYVSVKNALKAAKRSARNKDMILITGSIFVVAEIL